MEIDLRVIQKRPQWGNLDHGNGLDPSSRDRRATVPAPQALLKIGAIRGHMRQAHVCARPLGKIAKISHGPNFEMVKLGQPEGTIRVENVFLRKFSYGYPSRWPPELRSTGSSQ